MKKNVKLNLNDLNVESFVTSLEDQKKILTGATFDLNCNTQALACSGPGSTCDNSCQQQTIDPKQCNNDNSINICSNFLCPPPTVGCPRRSFSFHCFVIIQTVLLC